MKKILKLTIYAVAALLIIGGGACAVLVWRIGPFWLRDGVELPVVWSASTGWSAQARSRTGEVIQLTECRLGPGQAPWLTVKNAVAREEILTLEIGAEPVDPARLAAWLTQLELPVRLVVFTGPWGEAVGDRHSGEWRLTRTVAHGDSDQITWDGAGSTRIWRGAHLPEDFAAWWEETPLTAEVRGVRWEGRLVTAFDETAPREVSIKTEQAEYTRLPNGWRLTRREVELAEPLPVSGRRVSFSGIPGETAVRLNGEVTAVNSALGQLWLPNTVLRQAEISAEWSAGQWRWRLTGNGGAQPWSVGALTGALGAFEWNADGLQLNFERLELPLAGGTLAAEAAVLTVDAAGVMRWQAANGVWEHGKPGWSPVRLEQLSGNETQIQIARAKLTGTMPEWDFTADEIQVALTAVPEVRLGILSGRGLDWNFLWREVLWRAGQAVGGALEFHALERIHGTAERATVAVDGEAAICRATGWQVKTPEWELIQTEALETEIFRGAWQGGYWRGELHLAGANGRLLPEGRWSFAVAQLRLPCEFPAAGMRPTMGAKPVEQSTLLRYQSELPPGEFNAGVAAYDQIPVGAVQAKLQSMPNAPQWEVEGRIALKDLGGAELYFSLLNQVRQWALPVSNWPADRQLAELLPAWRIYRLSGMVGIAGMEQAVRLELRGATLGVGAWQIDGVRGDLPLARLDAPVLAAPGTLEFARLGEWRAGSLRLEPEIGPYPWRIAAATGQWCGGQVEQVAPVVFSDQAAAVWVMNLTGVRLDELLGRLLGVTMTPAELALQGQGEWQWLPDGRWQLNHLMLTGDPQGVLRLPQLGERLEGTSVSADFFRAMLGGMVCRSFALTLTAAEAPESGWNLQLVITGRPENPLPFVLSGRMDDAFAPTGEGEPPFQGEIEFEINLQIH